MFNSFVRSLSRALRTLIESTALNMFLQHHARRQREDLLDISLSLPFQTDVNTGYGILIKVYLDGLVHLYGGAVVDADAEGVRQAKDEALDFCDETFNGVKDPRGEVLRGFRFWDAVRSRFLVWICVSRVWIEFDLPIAEMRVRGFHLFPTSRLWPRSGLWQRTRVALSSWWINLKLLTAGCRQCARRRQVIWGAVAREDAPGRVTHEGRVGMYVAFYSCMDAYDWIVGGKKDPWGVSCEQMRCQCPGT